MKNLLLSAVASMALTAGMVSVAGVAHADSTSTWTLTKVKNTTITENTTILKTETITINDTLALDSEASALVVINSTVEDAKVGNASFSDPVTGTSGFGSFSGDPFNYGIRRTSTIHDSVEHDVGVGQVNQDSGNNSNQGNVISAGFVFNAVTSTATGTGTIAANLANAEAMVEQLSEHNDSRNIEEFSSGPNNGLVKNTAFSTTGSAPDEGPLVPQIEATLDDSFDHDVGVFMGNQNAGNNNEQHNALAAAIGDNTFTALSTAALHQLNTGNHVFDVNTVKEDLIHNSVNFNQGLVMFNQSVGENNNQATVVSLAAISSFVDLP